MIRIIPLLFIILLASCAATSQPGGSTATTGYKNSPSNVVIKFLDSIKTNDFGSAFKYIHSPQTDKQGYVSRMKNLVEKSNNRIIDYNLIGTRIIGETSYIIVELELELNTQSSEKSLRYTKNQYELTLINGKWKIVKDQCIENCTNT
jgi:hypothetical protein